MAQNVHISAKNTKRLPPAQELKNKMLTALGKTIKVWTTLKQWSDDKQLEFKKTAMLALPFLTRLLIEGETAIGEDVLFSGPVVARYLLTILEDYLIMYYHMQLFIELIQKLKL